MKSDVNLKLIDTKSKSYRDAMNNGFDVKWETDNITKTCETPFTLNDVTDLCNYGLSCDHVFLFPGTSRLDLVDRIALFSVRCRAAL